MDLLRQAAAAFNDTRGKFCPVNETTQTDEASSVLKVAVRPVDSGAKQLSFFEFWPTWVMYLPVAGLWIVLALRHLSLTVPLLANPKLKLSGMVGASKSQLFCLFCDTSQPWLLPWVSHTMTSDSLDTQVQLLVEAMRLRKFSFPVVAKPEIGCRGAGVKLIKDERELCRYMHVFPQGAALLIQKLSTWESEAGIFYVRYPDEKQGRILSMAFKHTPYVIGDGVSTLRKLIESDLRAGQVSHLYFARLQDQLDTVIERGQSFRLLFSASHCRGAVFRDASEHVTEALICRLDEILGHLPEFHYGRLDVKYRCLDSLRRGENLEILEINGASSESLHIWDRRARLSDAIKTLLSQYRHLFAIGVINRKKGYAPPSVTSFWRAWRLEKQLTRQYPPND